MDIRTPPSPPWRPGRHGATGDRIWTEYCRRRFGGGPKNAIIAFQPPWYKSEVPQPLRRPTQTHVGPSARAPTDRGTWGFGKGVVSSDFAVEVGHCACRAPPRHLGGRPEHGSGLRCMRTCRKPRNRPLERRSELLRAESPIPGGVRHSGPHEVLGGILVESWCAF